MVNFKLMLIFTVYPMVNEDRFHYVVINEVYSDDAFDNNLIDAIFEDMDVSQHAEDSVIVFYV